MKNKQKEQNRKFKNGSDIHGYMTQDKAPQQFYVEERWSFQ